jgi:hypothetical protein
MHAWQVCTKGLGIVRPNAYCAQAMNFNVCDYFARYDADNTVQFYLHSSTPVLQWFRFGPHWPDSMGTADLGSRAFLMYQIMPAAATAAVATGRNHRHRPDNGQGLPATNPIGCDECSIA